uniref:Uncharacterized protein n=1 Tax=Arion vulgaris TaxID=1028688 RepID=A0A0B7BTD3_9EUPU
MTSNIRKASSMIRKSFRSRRRATFDCKENINSSITTSVSSIDVNNTKLENERFRARNLSTSVSSSEAIGDVSTMVNPGSPPVLSQSHWLRRGTSMTQSMRDAVGTFRQKLRMSTRRGRLHITPSRVGTRRHTIGGREAQLRAPVKASTPGKSGRTHIKTCLSLETPTKLRREVESLTSNLQALNALTPNTLESRFRTRKSPPVTNGKTPRSAGKRKMTEIY